MATNPECNELNLGNSDRDILSSMGSVFRCGSIVRMSDDVDRPTLFVTHDGDMARGVVTLPESGEYDLTDPRDGVKRHIATVATEDISGLPTAVREFVGDCGELVINAIQGND